MDFSRPSNWEKGALDGRGAIHRRIAKREVPHEMRSYNRANVFSHDVARCSVSQNIGLAPSDSSNRKFPFQITIIPNGELHASRFFLILVHSALV